jgi:hypothetical protein
MKLAEALALRSDAQKRASQLQARALATARYQEGEQPPESAADLLAEARAVVDEVETLVRRINRTNAATELEPGVTITDAIARRDALALHRKVLAAVADAAAGRGDGRMWRQLRSELREVTDLPVGELRREADDVSRQYRELDVRLQQANWATDLVE